MGHKRDEEIQRLISYGKGLGVKVTIRTKTQKDNEAEWALDGTEINVFGGNDKSKTDIILDLIHELGHHLHFIHEKNRKPDIKFEEAITRENLFQVDTDVPTPKHLRKKILDVEIAGTNWWQAIYKDTNIGIPLWKVEAAKSFDIWMYEMYYKTGSFPKRKEKIEKHKEVRDRFKTKKDL